MKNYRIERLDMVAKQVENRGVLDALVLAALRNIPREMFIPGNLESQAYQDKPLVIEPGLVLPQAYVVAYMAEALQLSPGAKVLIIGIGSGYTAAVLADIANEVYVIEHRGQTASKAAAVLSRLGCENVHVQHTDDVEGWAEKAPFDGILVAESLPLAEATLESLLADNGRLVMVTGSDERSEELVRITRQLDGKVVREDIADVRLVPVLDEDARDSNTTGLFDLSQKLKHRRQPSRQELAELIAQQSEPFDTVHDADVTKLLERIGDRRLVLLGEASHGTADFHQMRFKLTRRLIEEKGFNLVALEADWPDAARIDTYVRGRDVAAAEWNTFSRFPAWMWRNEEVREFVDWLHFHNSTLPYDSQTACYGLDLYSLYNSANAVVDYLEKVDPDLAMAARHRYGCFTPWLEDPAGYGHAALKGAYQNCEAGVVSMLLDLHARRQEYAYHGSEHFLDAEQNARLVVDAERYYRIMYYGSRAAWNLRDGHMFDTLQNVLDFHGKQSKAVVWAHNSHIGDAAATEMGRRGENNLGEFCRKGFGADCYSIGFGTHGGTVAAAPEWGAAMEVMSIQPSHPNSYEHLCHSTSLPGFLLHLGAAANPDLLDALLSPRLERAIGVIYRPESELFSHYFEAELPRQFDEYIWLDRTHAITPLSAVPLEGMPDTYPFGL